MLAMRGTCFLGYTFLIKHEITTEGEHCASSNVFWLRMTYPALDALCHTDMEILGSSQSTNKAIGKCYVRKHANLWTALPNTPVSTARP